MTSPCPNPLRPPRDAALFNVMGTAVGAAHSPAVDAIVEAARELSAPGGSRVLGRSDTLDEHWAALLTGTAGHYDDFDDTHLATVIHPGAATLGALVAVARQRLWRRGAVGLRAGVRVAAAHRQCHLAQSLRPWVAHHRHVRSLRRGSGGRSAARSRRPGPRGRVGRRVDDDAGAPRGVRFDDQALPRRKGRRERGSRRPVGPRRIRRRRRSAGRRRGVDDLRRRRRRRRTVPPVDIGLGAGTQHLQALSLWHRRAPGDRRCDRGRRARSPTPPPSRPSRCAATRWSPS